MNEQITGVHCDLKRLMFQWQAEKAQRLSFRKLAAETGKGERTLRRWASNKVDSYDATVLVALCRFFGVGIETLLVLDGQEPVQ